MLNILLAEDESAIADTVIYALSSEGFQVQHCLLGSAALQQARSGRFDLAVLDVGLPDMSGFDVCRELRKFSSLPVIFLTARGSEIDRLIGLEIGADDYMVKPFSPRELAARIRVVLRRLHPAPAADASASPPAVLGEFELDQAGMRIRYGGHALQLTRYEYLLLNMLLSRPGGIFTRQQLMDSIWRDAPDSTDRTVDTHVKTLRIKLKAVAPAADPIHTHRGLGYSIELAPNGKQAEHVKLGIRILLGYFLIVGLAGVFIQRVFLAEVKPAVRQAMEDTLVDTANILAELAADDMKQNRIADGNFASRVREYAHRDINAKIWSFRKTTLDYRIYVTDLKGIVQFDSTGRAIGQDYSRRNDVYLTLRGNYGVRSTRDIDNDDSSTVMHVAAPIIDQGKMIGVLTVAKPNNTLQPAISQSERTILRWGALLLVLSLAVGLAVTLWISRSLGALQRYARAVTAGERAQPPARGASEIVELGRALESMRQRLEGKQYVEHYIHSLTHEMKSPLAAIRGAAELLDEDLPAAEQRRFAHNIRGQSQRLSELIEKMLALAAIEHRQVLENVVAIDLGALLDEVLNLLEPRLQRAALTVRIDKYPPGTTPQPTIRGEVFLLRQALINLLENAIDFSPPDSLIAIKTDFSQPGTVTLSVADSGPGIPDYALPRIFERFYSLPRPGSNEKSTGLGLCFVQQVAQLHHGQISLQNRSEGGAEAQLSLPADPA